jgi:hypothetical protein
MGKILISVIENKSRLGGLGGSVITVEPKGRILNPAEVIDFEGRQIRSTNTFGWEVMPEALCRKI